MQDILVQFHPVPMPPATSPVWLLFNRFAHAAEPFYLGRLVGELIGWFVCLSFSLAVRKVLGAPVGWSGGLLGFILEALGVLCVLCGDLAPSLAATEFPLSKNNAIFSD